METRARDLDVRYYREPSRKLPRDFSFRFRSESQHTMIYGRNVDLTSIKRLGAITRVQRMTWVIDHPDGAVSLDAQYSIDFSLPIETPLVLGKVSILPPGASNIVNYK